MQNINYHHLSDRHFAMAITLAIVMHLSALAVWSLKPQVQAIQIPVRVLNIKLGDVEETETGESTIAEPQPMNTEHIEEELMKSFQPPPEPVKAVRAPDPIQPPAQKAVQAKATPDQVLVKEFVRNRPFDYKPLGKEAAQAAKAQGSDLGNSNLSQADKLDKYVKLISVWAEKFQVYPPSARLQKLEGTVFVRLRIDRQGRVRKAGVDQRSSYADLDRAALETVNRADPFPPVPADFKPNEELLEFILPVRFTMKAK